MHRNLTLYTRPFTETSLYTRPFTNLTLHTTIHTNLVKLYTSIHKSHRFTSPFPLKTLHPLNPAIPLHTVIQADPAHYTYTHPHKHTPIHKHHPPSRNFNFQRKEKKKDTPRNQSLFFPNIRQTRHLFLPLSLSLSYLSRIKLWQGQKYHQNA